jgi:hypothetical protein
VMSVRTPGLTSRADTANDRGQCAVGGRGLSVVSTEATSVKCRLLYARSLFEPIGPR